MKDSILGKTHSKEDLDDYSNQNNPNSNEYQSKLDNHANQNNPNYK